MLVKKISRRHFKIFFLFFLEYRLWHFVQIVSLGDNLHELSKPSLWEKKKKKKKKKKNDIFVICWISPHIIKA